MANRYTIVGDGRVAKHMAHYFTALNIPFNQWSRKSESDLKTLSQESDRILLLISDGAIEDFFKKNIELQQKKVVHFSGALALDGMLAAHPLVSFAHDFFDLDFYKQIPFCIEAEGPVFAEVLPGLPNSSFAVPRMHKAFYHALNVMSGNFTTILWQKLFSELEQQWNIPREVAFTYLQSVLVNLKNNSQAALTGPLARNDRATIEKNLAALVDDPFKKIYQTFVEMYQ